MYPCTRPVRFAAILMVFFFISGLVLAVPPASAADATLEWNGTVFREDSSNDGSIDNYIEVSIVQDAQPVEFVQISDLVHQELIYVDNLPEGLRCAASAVDPTTCRIYLYGRAEKHNQSDSIENLKIQFTSGAFTTGNADAIYDNGRNNLEIRFTGSSILGDGRLDWSATEFVESDRDDGSISTVITVQLKRGSGTSPSFAGSLDMVSDGYAQVHYLPEGLRCLIEARDKTSCTVTLTGRALRHAPEDSIDYFGIEFLDGAFIGSNASQVMGSSMSSMGIVFSAREEEPAQEEPREEQPETMARIVSAFVLDEYSYSVNGIANAMDVAPFARDNRSFVPLRYLAHGLGIAEEGIAWDASSSTATLSASGIQVSLQAGSSSLVVNGQISSMDVETAADSGRLFIPARFVAEAFGGRVEWHPDSKTVMIYRDIQAPV